MDTRQALRENMAISKMVVDMYLGDLTDADLLVRPAPGCNHIAWQLGHLIESENEMTEAVAPGSMPPLPKGFKEKHKKETAKLDDAAAFHKKAEYVKLAAEQREAALAALDKLSDADLGKPAPESMRAYAPTVCAIFAMHGAHWLMHAGQWAVVRRKLGRPPLF